MVAVIAGEQVSECRRSVVPYRQVERSRREAAVAGQRFEDRLYGDVEVFGDLGWARGTPELVGELASAVLIRAWSSWMLRVGRIIQPWSRKYLRSSPRIVGPAYDMNSFPVLTS